MLCLYLSIHPPSPFCLVYQVSKSIFNVVLQIEHVRCSFFLRDRVISKGLTTSLAPNTSWVNPSFTTDLLCGFGPIAHPFYFLICKMVVLRIHTYQKGCSEDWLVRSVLCCSKLPLWFSTDSSVMIQSVLISRVSFWPIKFPEKWKAMSLFPAQPRKPHIVLWKKGERKKAVKSYEGWKVFRSAVWFSGSG